MQKRKSYIILARLAKLFKGIRVGDLKNYSISQSAANVFFLAIWHGADSILLADEGYWRPAAVSLHFSLHCLSLSLMLLDQKKVKRVLKRDKYTELQKRQKSVILDPLFANIGHQEAVDYIKSPRVLSKSQLAKDSQKILDLREFASYGPKIEILGDAKTKISVEKHYPRQFQREIKKYTASLPSYFSDVSQFVSRKLDRANFITFTQSIMNLRKVLLDGHSKKYHRSDTYTLAQELYSIGTRQMMLGE